MAMARAAPRLAAIRTIRAPRPLAAVARAPRRGLSDAGDAKQVEKAAPQNQIDTKKVWGSTLELKEFTKEQANEKYLEVTDIKRTLMPPTAEAVKARDDMLNDRFNYVSTHLSNENAYIVAGKHGSVAPAAVGQTGMAVATLCVLLGAIASVVYVKNSWGVSSAKDLGDKLREKGAARREALEGSGTVRLVRTVSANAETAVKSNVELVRRPSQQVGEHLEKSLKGIGKSKDSS